MSNRQCPVTPRPLERSQSYVRTGCVANHYPTLGALVRKRGATVRLPHGRRTCPAPRSDRRLKSLPTPDGCAECEQFVKSKVARSLVRSRPSKVVHNHGQALVEKRLDKCRHIARMSVQIDMQSK